VIDVQVTGAFRSVVHMDEEQAADLTEAVDKLGESVALSGPVNQTMRDVWTELRSRGLQVCSSFVDHRRSRRIVVMVAAAAMCV
jgi:hypothetical protein